MNTGSPVAGSSTYPHSFVIALQCRTGSTRLPGKMTRTFFQGQTILEIMLAELKSVFPTSSIVVATSTADGDAKIQAMCETAAVACFRGSEDDVLDRVWNAVRDRNVTRVVRICADNPFLRAAFVEQLLKIDADCEYASFQLPDGTPTILSHVGLFAEMIAFDTLSKIHATATSTRHREHLTSHVLDNRDQYQCHWLRVPDDVSSVPDLRLTVDTAADFENSQTLYKLLHSEVGHGFQAAQLISTVKQCPQLIASMTAEIAANSKA